MDWDVFPSLDHAPVGAERSLLPAGRQRLTVKSATEGPHRFLDGDFLMMRLAPAEPGYGLVFCDIGQGPRDARLAGSLSQAIGGEASGRVSLLAADLEGKQVDAEIVHATGKDGTVRPRVAMFYAPRAADPEPQAEKPARRRTATQKVDAEVRTSSPDDIPF
jgi:hypothetical protein